MIAGAEVVRNEPGDPVAEVFQAYDRWARDFWPITSRVVARVPEAVTTAMGEGAELGHIASSVAEIAAKQAKLTDRVQEWVAQPAWLAAAAAVTGAVVGHGTDGWKGAEVAKAILGIFGTLAVAPLFYGVQVPAREGVAGIIAAGQTAKMNWDIRALLASEGIEVK